MKIDERKSEEDCEELSNNIAQIPCYVSSTLKEHMSEDEIRKRLTDRAMTYLMFLDD